MSDPHTAKEAVARAGRRAAYHLIQALVESLKAVEAVIEEIGSIGEEDQNPGEDPVRERIEIE